MSDFQLLKNYQNHHHQWQSHLKKRNKVLIGEALFAWGAGEGRLGGVVEQGSGGSEFHQHGCNRGCGEFRICLLMQLYYEIVISKLTSMQKFKCVFYL